MAIELWWFVEPLFETGIVTFMLFTPVAVLFDKMQRPSLAAFAVIMAVLPLVFVTLCIVVCLATNVLIWNWR
jgi:hypothetical protein